MSIAAGATASAGDFVSSSSGASDSGKVAKLNASGQIPDGFIARPVNVQEFIADGTWTKPSSAAWCFVEIWGAGGSGGAAGGSQAAATGGGGGEYRSMIIPAQFLGATETVTVGVGGASVQALYGFSPANGNAGEDTTFGSWGTAKGGAAGSATTTNNTDLGGAAGGSGGSSNLLAVHNANGTASGAASTNSTGSASNGTDNTYAGAGGGSSVSDDNIAHGTGGNSTYAGDGGDGIHATSSGTYTAEDGEDKGGGGGASTAKYGSTTCNSGAGGDGFARITCI